MQHRRLFPRAVFRCQILQSGSAAHWGVDVMTPIIFFSIKLMRSADLNFALYHEEANCECLVHEGQGWGTWSM